MRAPTSARATRSPRSRNTNHLEPDDAADVARQLVQLQTLPTCASPIASPQVGRRRASVSLTLEALWNARSADCRGPGRLKHARAEIRPNSSKSVSGCSSSSPDEMPRTKLGGVLGPPLGCPAVGGSQDADGSLLGRFQQKQQQQAAKVGSRNRICFKPFRLLEAPPPPPWLAFVCCSRQTISKPLQNHFVPLTVS